MIRGTLSCKSSCLYVGLSWSLILAVTLVLFNAVFTFHMHIAEGQALPNDISIDLLDDLDSPMRIWCFTNASSLKKNQATP